MRALTNRTVLALTLTCKSPHGHSSSTHRIPCAKLALASLSSQAVAALSTQLRVNLVDTVGRHGASMRYNWKLQQLVQLSQMQQVGTAARGCGHQSRSAMGGNRRAAK